MLAGQAPVNAPVRRPTLRIQEEGRRRRDGQRPPPNLAMVGQGTQEMVVMRQWRRGGDRQVGGDGGKGYTHTGTDGSALPCRRQRTHVSILGRRQNTAAAVVDRCGGVGGCNRRSDGDTRG